METEKWGIHPKTQRRVSSFGKVEGDRVEFLAHSLQESGYYTVTIKGKTLYLHRILVETFVGEIPENMQINHIDGNKQNNDLSNLEIVTAQENCQHAYRMGLNEANRGEDAGMAKLSNEDVIEIYRLILEGKNNTFIAEKFDIYSGHISSLRHGHRWPHLFDKYLKGKTFQSTQGVLDFDTKVEIIKQIKAGVKSQEIADKYGTDVSNFSRVRNKKIWKGVWKFVENQENPPIIQK